MDIVSNKPSIGPKIELFQDNNISVQFLFPDEYNLSNLSVKLNKKLDNSLISDANKQPIITVIDNVFYVTFSKEKLKLLSAPFVLYIYDTDAAIIGCDCVVSNKTGEYNDIVTEVIIGDETIIEVNTQLNYYNGTLNINDVPIYANNSLAISAGLSIGKIYRTDSGILMIRY